MIDIGTSIIIGSIISLIGIIIVIQLNNHNWFKKQIFKDNKNQLKQINSIKLDQLKKELGIKSVEPKELNLGPIIDRLTGSEDEEDQEGIAGIIQDIIRNNPELVQQYAPELIKRFLPNLNKDETKDKFI